MKNFFLLLLFSLSLPAASRAFAFGAVSYYSERPNFPDTFASPVLVRAARIAEQRAHRHSQMRCWKYVKDALLEAGAVTSRPRSSYAFQAVAELTSRYGFVDTGLRNPYHAPVGAVIVYGGHGAGHVELRTAHGFASDYRSAYRCGYTRVLGILVKARTIELASAN